MRSTKRRPSTRAPRGNHSGPVALSPYLVEEVAFTLEEIRRARDAAPPLRATPPLRAA
jgi:hypothetical protein